MRKTRRDKNAPITDRAEYERLVKKMQRKRVVIATSLIVLAVVLFLIMITSGGILKIFGVKNTYKVMNVFYGAFYVITGIVIAILLVVGCVFLIKQIINFIKGFKDR